MTSHNPLYICCYSYGDTRRAYFDLIKNADLHDKIQPIWGFNNEGEINGLGCEIGDPRKTGNAVAGLWCMIGNLALCRFYSKHLALRMCCIVAIMDQLLRCPIVEIKAYEENVFGVRYSSGN